MDLVPGFVRSLGLESQHQQTGPRGTLFSDQRYARAGCGAGGPVDGNVPEVGVAAHLVDVAEHIDARAVLEPFRVRLLGPPVDGKGDSPHERDARHGSSYACKRGGEAAGGVAVVVAWWWCCKTWPQPEWGGVVLRLLSWCCSVW